VTFQTRPFNRGSTVLGLNLIESEYSVHRGADLALFARRVQVFIR
jgi:hypothetical protein